MILSLDPETIIAAVTHALNEDIGRGDITTRSTVRPGVNARGNFLAKQDLTLAGLEIADFVFTTFDPHIQIESTASDGEFVAAGKVFARVTGDAHFLLTAERTALNFVQQLSVKYSGELKLLSNVILFRPFEKLQTSSTNFNQI